MTDYGSFILWVPCGAYSSVKLMGICLLNASLREINDSVRANPKG